MLLSSFFNKSKPIAFLILFGYVSLLFWWNAAKLASVFSWVTFGKYTLLLVMLFGVNFIVKRNKINRKNTYAVFTFSMLCTALPSYFLDGHLLVASFFVVLGLRRILSLKTQIEPKKKIFDASLWFFVASLCQPHLVLLMLLVFMAVLIYTLYDPKNLFIPFVAWVCGALFFSAFQLWKTDEWMFFYERYSDFGWNNWHEIFTANIFFLSILIPFALLVLWGVSFVISKAKLSLKTSMTLVLVSFMLILSGWLYTDEHQLSGLGIAFIPLSMMAGKSMELKIRPIFKELTLWVLLLSSLVLGIFSG